MAWFVLFSVLLGLVFFACGVYFMLWKTRDADSGKLVLLFIDAPDPDNPAAAVAVWKHVLKQRGHLHIILTGRHLNLRTAKNLDVKVLPNQIHRQRWETQNEKHAQRVLEDSSKRISNYLIKCDIPASEFTLYHGGIAPKAPLSDAVHDWDFIFDRKDLISGNSEDEGEILTPDEYQRLLENYDDYSEDEREEKILFALRRYELEPLEKLRILLEEKSCRNISIFLGGPATALVKLFKENASLCDKVTEFYAMFGSTGTSTLFPNQFNIECDVNAATELLINGLLPRIQKLLITTETSKLKALVPSSSEMEGKDINPYVVKLHRLWESTHGDKPQPIFDVLPVMCSLTEYKNCFRWSAKKAVLQEWRDKEGDIKSLFSFADTDNSTLLVSEASFGADRECFLQFLEKTFSK